LSVSEDAVSFVLVWLATTHPWIGIALLAVLITLSVFVVWKISHIARRVLRKAS
jgi:hypothetical protein